MAQEKMTLFYEETDVFSNWFMEDFVDGNNVKFNCSEQAMMYYKAQMFGDEETAQKIMMAKHPSRQKALGREVKNFNSAKWDAVSRHVVYRACWFKFRNSPLLMKEILATAGTTLVEASDKDVLWGVGLSKDNPLIYDRKNWRGKNWLGQVLTQLRFDFIIGNSLLWDNENWIAVDVEFE